MKHSDEAPVLIDSYELKEQVFIPAPPLDTLSAFERKRKSSVFKGRIVMEGGACPAQRDQGCVWLMASWDKGSSKKPGDSSGCIWGLRQELVLWIRQQTARLATRASK